MVSHTQRRRGRGGDCRGPLRQTTSEVIDRPPCGCNRCPGKRPPSAGGNDGQWSGWSGMSRDVEPFDVVVVGARCAGSPLATMLARRGLRVCLLDRARFPSDTLSTHVIQPCGVAILDRLGVLQAVLRAGAVPLTAFTLVADDARRDAER